MSRTDLKAASQFLGRASLQAILQTSLDAILTIDESDRIESFNRAAEAMFGYMAADVIERKFDWLISDSFPDEGDEHLESILAETSQGCTRGHREMVGQRRDGTTFLMEVVVGEAQTADRRVRTAIIRDLSGRERAHAVRRALEERLQQSNRELEATRAEMQIKSEELSAVTQQLWQAAKLATMGELAASVAHELNNPLATVSLRIEGILAKTLPGDPRRAGLEVVSHEIERMGNLVSSLLQFSRRGQDRSSTLNVAEELLRTLELVQHRFRRHRVDIVQDFAADCPPIHANHDELRQVFLNLLINALDAMPSGGTLSLRVARGASKGAIAAVVVEIADTGAGIPSAILSRVMEPFFTTKEEGKGTGLGLAICRRIVEEQGGGIELLSEACKGTTVRITLPDRPPVKQAN